MPEFTGTSDLRGYVGILWRWKLLFLFFLVGAPLAAYLIDKSQPPRYQSSALVGVNSTTVNSSIVNGGGTFSTDNVTAIARLVTTSPVASVAADLMHPPANAGQIVGEVSATGDPNTNFVTISAEDRSPVRAAAIANAFAHAISQNLNSVATTSIGGQIKSLQAQLSHLGPNDPTRPALEQQLVQLRAASATQGSNSAILQPAAPAGSPVGLNTRRAVEIGLVIGLLLGLGAVVLAESADRRLRTPASLEAIAGLPLLAAIPSSAFSAKPEDKQEEETFHTLRSALTYFKLDQAARPGNGRRSDLRSILITSPGEKEGKTTVAVGLGLATAAAGLRVTVIDADLRRAHLGPRLGVAEETGLGAVLAGESSLEDVLVDYPLDDTDGQLTIVPAGPPRHKPGVLIGSDAMRAVLAAAESASDLVIIDSPAALAVSDSVPLMGLVSGVVLVARMQHSTRAGVARLQTVVQSAEGVPLGVVATGVTRVGYEYYSSKYYTTNGRRRSRRRDKRATAPEAHGPA